MLSDVSGRTCRDYVESRTSQASARRELEELRAAINYFAKEGLLREIIRVTLPPRQPPRERWLTRSEAAALLWAAWRHQGIQRGSATTRRPRRHVARFILIGLYAGRRSGAIVEAALEPMAGRGWIDVDRGIFHPSRAGRMNTRKQQPTIPIPARLLAHLRRWKRSGQRFAIEFNGQPVDRMAKAFRKTVEDAGLGADVTPHTLRHTAASWLMQKRVDPWAICDYLGMSFETLIRIYGHHDPDHLKVVRDAIDLPRPSKKRSRHRDRV